MKNTAVQEAIGEIKSKALAETHKSSAYWAYLDCIKILESKLDKEKQDLIDMYENGGENYAYDGHLIHGEEVFNAEFKQ